MNNETLYQVNKNRVLFSQVGDEGVIFDLEKNEYKILNETLFKIFDGIQSGHSKAQICAGLTAEYNISDEECAQKVEKILISLLQQDYILAVN